MFFFSTLYNRLLCGPEQQPHPIQHLMNKIEIIETTTDKLEKIVGTIASIANRNLSSATHGHIR